MSHPHADVALLTERRYAAETAAPGDWYLGNILREDQLLSDALADIGLSAVRLDWSRPDVDWSRFRHVVFRTTWDYFDRFSEFSAWLNRVESHANLCNPASLVRWNMDKHYLADLDATGVNVVPSRFIERGRQVNLLEMLTDTGWHDAIVKPCISGAARHTYRVNPATAAAVEPILNQLLTTESMILQPFQHDVIETGEDTLMVFGGCYTHAVRKTAKPGDFRVQDDHGGTVQEYTPTLDQVELAERAMAACRPVPAYGRVDMIRDNSERLAIMELELIEPELWLRLHPPAAIRLADSIAKMVANEQTRR